MGLSPAVWLLYSCAHTCFSCRDWCLSSSLWQVTCWPVRGKILSLHAVRSAYLPHSGLSAIFSVHPSYLILTSLASWPSPYLCTSVPTARCLSSYNMYLHLQTKLSASGLSHSILANVDKGFTGPPLHSP